jgi:HSP20 family protein
LPACNDEDVEVTVRNRILTVRGTCQREEKSKDEHYQRVERKYGDVARSFGLPEGITETDIGAKVAYGVLQVKITLPDTAKSTQIPVAGSDEQRVHPLSLGV